MSLVNDMLRDLNKRTPVSGQAARIHVAIESSIESKRPRARIGLIVVGCLLAGLGAGYFYFESMGVQLVQIPLAPVPQPLAQAVQSSTPAPAAAAPAPAQNVVAPAPAAELPAIENVAEIRELAMQPNGFTLLIETSEQTSFDVRDRSAFGLTLHIDGIDRYDRTGAVMPGMSLMLVSDGLDVGIELDRAADFLVREDSETAGYDILITASYRPREELSVIDAPASQPAPSATPSAPVQAPATVVAPSEQQSAPVRINRELSLEDRDRNNSQAALVLAQGGRMTEAYGQLLTFLEENPEAHQSRETLATLLLAQQEYARASAVVDQGLALVPNNAAFKKIKARLLMQANDSAQALTLLRNVPPAVTADTEYYELLASAYQQQGNHRQAVATYQDLLRIDRSQGRWWAGLGISLEAQNMPADAITSYRTALQSTNLAPGLRRYIQSRMSNLGNQP